MSDDIMSERGRQFYGNGGPTQYGKRAPKLVQPGTFSNELPRMGTRPEQIHHDKQVAYDHPKAQQYRAELRGRPSANAPGRAGKRK